MMGCQNGGQERLFYSFNLDDHVPANHLLRGIDQFLDLTDLRAFLAPFYSHTGRPSIDPELMIRMLIVGYCFGIRSERRLDDRAFGPAQASRAVREYLEGIDAEGRPETMRKSISLTDPAAEWTCAPGGPAFFAYSTNYLVDVRAGVIVDVEATSSHRTQEVEATRTMINRVERRFEMKPTHLIGDMAYGAAELLDWMVNDKEIQPHVPVWDKTQRTDETLSSSEFRWDAQANEYRCPEGHALRSQWRSFKSPRTHVTKADTIIYRSSQSDCAKCPVKARCCPNTPVRKIARSVYEPARDVARALASTPTYEQSRKERKKVEMLFAHLKKILKLDRLRLRGLTGARDEFLLAAVAQNLRRMAKKLCPSTTMLALGAQTIAEW